MSTTDGQSWGSTRGSISLLYAEQAIALQPQNEIGAAASRRPIQGLETERAKDHQSTARANGAKSIAEVAP